MRTLSARTVDQLLGPDRLARPAYRSLAAGLRRLIADGRILVDTRLPSERALMSQLGLSRTTVGAAFDVLRAEGFIVTRRGSGSVTALPEDRSGLALSRAGLVPSDVPDDVIDLTYAVLPAAAGLTAAYERALEHLPRHLATSGYHPRGLPELREALAGWYEGRGLPTDPGDIVITGGAHAALSAVLRAVLDPGDRVLLETPTYPNAIVGVRRSSLRPVPFPIDPLGWDPEHLELALRQGGARLAYLVPDFQNPTGRLMSSDERVSTSQVLRRTGSTPVIDETFVELGLDTAPPAPFAASSPEAITLGSSGKAWWGGLRVGWVRAPHALVAPILEARHSLDLGTAVLEQLVLVELLRSGRTLLDDRRAEARRRRDAMVAALRTHVPDWRFAVPPGGLNLWCELPVDRGDALSRVGEAAGVRLARGAQFGTDGGMDRFVRIPYSVPADEADDVGRRLANAWTMALESRSTREPATPLVA
ncbi:PLP-dependent aminotransferase family protein [Intrasporangium calvum]|uniref:Transcriptional regulator, GntR family with aminotransferase domain n=1 Tax=Intrasporangium calvum (strain ATCC 23552 / DSM 43043 / JCM 3097 / NBRC 12989 / NCIMB 10167 / NRRL B-3866 / 7 KIP) TaxID=710696 RepID=E6S6A7_INTC7|nr:PLP-dependent aminotransferase family protein [Intrasporangium calvum]ADU47858.1 transcriptional regulator, GntR family with aminotransferase domain [Intrasporangium calvum DSM 43043]AXG15279.1 PLP-dependent aminotransferase family protein [Intrasporangium calvum]